MHNQQFVQTPAVQRTTYQLLKAMAAPRMFRACAWTAVTLLLNAITHAAARTLQQSSSIPSTGTGLSPIKLDTPVHHS
jgi:hypothetical protein